MFPLKSTRSQTPAGFFCCCRGGEETRLVGSLFHLWSGGPVCSRLFLSVIPYIIFFLPLAVLVCTHLHTHTIWRESLPQEKESLLFKKKKWGGYTMLLEMPPRLCIMSLKILATCRETLGCSQEAAETSARTCCVFIPHKCVYVWLSDMVSRVNLGLARHMFKNQ